MRILLSMTSVVKVLCFLVFWPYLLANNYSPEANISVLPQKQSAVSTTDHFFGATMGTYYRVKLGANTTGPQESLQKLIDAALHKVNQAMSTYIPDSEISRFNRALSTKPYTVSRDFAQLVAKSQEISQESTGAFDITVGPLVNLWGFGSSGSRQDPPSTTAIKALQKHTGYRKLDVNPQASWLRKRHPKVAIDLSSIAKGLAVDQIADALEQQGYRHYMVDIGGELRLRGNKEANQPWKIGIEKPSGTTREILEIAYISAGSLATSGVYRQGFTFADKEYSHIIHPATGYPIERIVLSVSVWAPTAVEADAWATAFMVLGPEPSIRIAESKGLPLLMLVKKADSTAAWHRVVSRDWGLLTRFKETT